MVFRNTYFSSFKDSHGHIKLSAEGVMLLVHLFLLLGYFLSLNQFEFNVFKWLNILYSTVIGEKIPAHSGITVFVK